MAKSVKKAAAKSVIEVKLSNAKASKLSQILGEVGDTIGHAQIEVGAVEEMTIERVERLLRDAMAAGLVCDDKVNMLKASTEKNPNPLYDKIVDGINAPRIAVGKEPISDGTRYNVTSRIRQFVRDRGAQPLDLYGHIADRKAKEERLASQKKEKELQAKAQEQANAKAEESSLQSEKSKPAAVPVAEPQSFLGAAVLRDFLASWIEHNGQGKPSQQMNFLLDTADDLLQATLHFIAEKQAENKVVKTGKGKKAKVSLERIEAD